MSKEAARKSLIEMIDVALKTNGSIALFTIVPEVGTQTQLAHCDLIDLLLIQHSMQLVISKHSEGVRSIYTPGETRQ